MTSSVITALLSGCGGGGGGSDPSTPNEAPPPPPASGAFSLSGHAYGATRPIVGATVRVYAAGNAYGSATELASATTDAGGGWSVKFDCPQSGPPIYVVATGGNAGSGDNAAIALSGVAGHCGRDSLVGSITLNEVTTVAAAYTLSAFLDATGMQPGSPDSNRVGLDNAIAAFANLADPVTGATAAALVAGASGTTPTATINTLANILASCIKASGRADAACAKLFSTAAPPGGGAASDTLQAVLNIARTPGSNVGALYELGADKAAIAAPVLTTAPTDWILELRLSGGGLDRPLAVAIDASGNAWVANYGSAVSKLAPDGRTLAGASGFTGGGLLESFGIAIAADGSAWVANQESPADVNNKHGSVTHLAADGTVLSGTNGYFGGGINYPVAVVTAADGSVYVANYANSSLSWLNADGSPVSPPGGFVGGGLAYPVALALDANGLIWLSNHGGDSVSELTDTGTPLSPEAGYRTTDIQAPEGLCSDSRGTVWVLGYLSNRVVALRADGGPGAVVQPGSGYGGGGLQNPSGCAVDGKGTLWVTNYTAASLSAFRGTETLDVGTPLSPDIGYVAGLLSQPSGLAVDRSGNIWIANAGDDSISLLLGIAAPVKTPTMGPPESP